MLRTHFQTTRLSLSLLLLALVIGGQPSPAHAQAGSGARVEMARLVDNQTLQLQVAVPRGQTVEQAVLALDGASVELDPEPVRLPVNQWIVLDAGSSTVNMGSPIQAGVTRFLQNTADDLQTGLVLYAAQPTVYNPVANTNTVRDYLTQYTTQVNEPGCVWDALAALAELERPVDRARRVLLIAGEVSRQGLCITENYISVSAPIDMIIISETPDDAYLDIQERSGGELLSANVRTLDDRLNQIKTLWSQPVYNLSGQVGNATTTVGTLQLTLSNNTQIDLDVRLEAITTESDNQRGGLTVLGDNTPVPTNTPAPLPTNPPPTVAPPTAESVIAQQPTADTSAAQPEQPLPTNPPPTVAPPTAESVIAQQPTADTSAAQPTTPATETSAAAQDAPTEIAAADTPAAASDPESPTSDNADTADDTTSEAEAETTAPIAWLPAFINTNDPIILAGGGLIGVALLGLIGVIIYAVRPRRSSPAPYMDDRTIVDEPEHTAIDLVDEPFKPGSFYSSLDNPAPTPRTASARGGGTLPELNTGGDDDELDYTEMVDESEYDVTEIITEDEMLDSVRRTVGYLTIADTGQQYVIDRQQTSLGRADECDIVIKGDQRISRLHLQLEVREQDGEDTVWLVVKTKNPFLYNERFIEKDTPTQLQSGDELKLSPNTTMIFTTTEPEA